MVRYRRDERAKTLETPQVPVVSHPNVSCRGRRRQFQSANTRDLIADHTRQDSNADPLPAHAPLDVAVVRSQDRSCVGETLDEPRDVGEVGRGWRDQPETGPIAIFRIGRLLGDVDAVFEPEEPPLNDIGSVERNGTKSDFGLPLGEAEPARAGQDFDVDIGVGFREIRQDRRQDLGPEPVS